KVIYARRDQILEGADLKSAAMEYLADAVNALLETYCASPADDEWDLDGLAKELVTFWPTEVDEERLEDCRNTAQMFDVVMADAAAHSGPSAVADAAAPATATPPARAAKGGNGRTTAPGGGGLRNLQTSSSDDVSGSAFERAAAGTATIEQQAARQANRPAKQE